MRLPCLAAILMAALAALLIFAIVDANRINRSLSELQQTVNYKNQPGKPTTSVVG